MVRFFRNLRQDQAARQRLGRYLLYAIGEIFLIIFGILIALHVNERSIRRDKQDAFQTAMNQVYIDLQNEMDWYLFLIASYERQTAVALEELDGPEKLEPQEAPARVAYLNSLALGDKNLVNEALLLRLNENITSREESLLVNKISNYYSTWQGWNKVIDAYKIRFLDGLSARYELPFIENYVLINYEPYHGKKKEFSATEIQKAVALREDPSYRTQIRSILNRNSDLVARFETKVEQSRAILEAIREFGAINPFLRFREIGLVGSATEGGWDTTSLMEQTRADSGIWETRIRLDSGEVKFRNGDSWEYNWGESSMQMDGNLMNDGYNIPVRPGYYLVRINLLERTYALEEIPPTH